MSKEFYKYIAKNTLSFFRKKKDVLQPGERYCLKLDNEEMVKGVTDALEELLNSESGKGKFIYDNVYCTFTIKISSDQEIVVASKMNGMTDDFMSTLRNADLTDKHFPILMIVHSTNDTISSGTGDLTANGMPFHTKSIIENIEKNITESQLSDFDRILLEFELKKKQYDRYNDDKSLYGYSHILTVLQRGYLIEGDFPNFGLLPDPEFKHEVNEKKIKDRLLENHKNFDLINRVFKNGNIQDDLEKEYDTALISSLVDLKKKGEPWYKECTLDVVLKSKAKLSRRLDNPLNIEKTNFEIYSGSALEYPFIIDDLAFIKDDGETKSKKRKKNVLIYNPDKKDSVIIELTTNIPVKAGAITKEGADVEVNSKTIYISINSEGCSFAKVSIKDLKNNITFEIKICIIELMPTFLEDIQTSYTLNIRKNLRNNKIEVYNIGNKLCINPGYEVREEKADNKEYEISLDQTLNIMFSDDSIDYDTGFLDCSIKIGDIRIPLSIHDQRKKSSEITGINAFKWKFEKKKSFQYRGQNKIVLGTEDFYAKDPFKTSLEVENLMIQNSWVAAIDSSDGLQEYKLDIPSNVKDAYINLVLKLKDNRFLPSLTYYEDELYSLANSYIKEVEKVFSDLQEGATLSKHQSNVLMIGCVIKSFDEDIIEMSPLHPLNILYQLELQKEENVGKVRDSLVEKLTPLNLLPYIKDSHKELYHAIEQKHSPEWRIYAQASNKRYQGSRNYVQKLVSGKIKQYKEHFSFLFEDLGNNQMTINLVNLGDCREIIQGIIHFYVSELKNGLKTEELLTFVINIYDYVGTYNEFSLLSNHAKLKEFISRLSIRDMDDIGEIALILTNNIKCFFKSIETEEYEYAHLSFFEMSSAEDTGASRMDSIITGVSLSGITSGIPSVLNASWYKTGFGLKYSVKNRLLRLAKYYNALSRVAYSGSSFEPESCTFTEIEKGQEGILGKLYRSSNWVVFIDPKVDLSFFQKDKSDQDELMIIHYSDQYTSASGYDDITVTQKSEQYNDIIVEQLNKKGVKASRKDVNNIISLFNAVNGGWMLKLITAKKNFGAADSYFSREKMSILSAIKLCMAYYNHEDIVWVPISLEEMLRVSGGVGLSQNEGLLSAKNLGFEQRVTSDDILLVGIEGPKDNIKVYFHPVEVKIGQNQSGVLNKAKEQVINTYTSLWNALWPLEGRNNLECKLSRNFLMQLVILCCEKMKLYEIYPDENWDNVLYVYRENLLNENYEFSNLLDKKIGKGTVVSFGADTLNKSGSLDNDICLLEFPEKLGSAYMVYSAKDIENELDKENNILPPMLKDIYKPTENPKDQIKEIEKQVEKKESQIDDNMMKTDKKQDNILQSYFDINNSDSKKNIADEKEIYKTDNQKENVREPGINVLFGNELSSGKEIYWKPNDTSQIFHTNTGIIGTMGTGKTQFTKSIITQLYTNRKDNFGSEDLGILIFDYKGDYNESKEDFCKATNAQIYKPYHLPFNPLALTRSKVFKPLLPIHTANAFKYTLSKIYNLGPKQQSILSQCINEAYYSMGIFGANEKTWSNAAPTFSMVNSIYQNNEEIKKNDSLAAVMEKLAMFEVFESDPNKTRSLFEILKGVVVIDLSGYDSDIQNLVVAITLDLFYSQMQAAGSSKMDQKYRQLTKLILVDEADNFMSEEFPALKKILKEGREFGVGTILSTQFLKHFGNSEDDYSKYILTWVVHNVSDLKNSDVDFVFKTEPKSELSQNLFNDIKSLKKHNSIIKIGNQKPKYIKDKAFWELYQELDFEK